MKTLLIGWFDEEGIKKKFDIKDDELYIISDKARRMVYRKNKTQNVYYIDDINDLDEYKRVLGEIGMKFDKVIMNPPYEKNLHLKVVEEVLKFIEDDGTVINLSPIEWLQDPLAELKKNCDRNKYEETICKKIKQLEKIPGKVASKLFDVQVGNLGIYTLSNKGGYDYKSLNVLTSISRKVIDYKDYISDHVIELNKKTIKNKYFVYVCEIYGGNINTGSGFIKPYGYVKPAASTAKGERQDYGVVFRTKNEAINFSESSKTLFMRYLCTQFRRGYHYGLGKYFPYMQDYTQPWTNERFYKYFNITEEEQKIIEETMAQYES